jgi:hypothetical protein
MSCRFVSCHADEIPNGFNLCKKTIAEERGNLIPLLMKGINGSYVYDHLTGSGNSHCSDCYQYLTPMGLVKSLRIFFFSLYGILSTSSVFVPLREIAKDVLFYSVCNYYTSYISFAPLCEMQN